MANGACASTCPGRNRSGCCLFRHGYKKNYGPRLEHTFELKTGRERIILERGTSNNQRGFWQYLQRDAWPNILARCARAISGNHFKTKRAIPAKRDQRSNSHRISKTPVARRNAENADIVFDEYVALFLQAIYRRVFANIVSCNAHQWRIMASMMKWRQGGARWTGAPTGSFKPI